MTFTSWTFVFEIVNFVVLAYLLRCLLYRPLHEAVDRRRQVIEQARTEAEQAREEAEEQRRQLAAQLAAVEGERQRVLTDARREAEAQREHILAEASQETERCTAASREALARERAEALRSLRQDMVHEAAQLAGRLLLEVSDADLDARLAGRLADTVRSLPAKERERLARTWTDGEPATVEVAHDLPADAVEPVRDAVAEILGRDVPLRVQAAPELVSGARLRLDGNVWDASLAGQLEEIEDGHPGAAGQ
jgi:F-type H+-transporting ATPase subunit b